ncbi:MAG: WD40 repeat domain-containing serine/threonine protein kinase [Ktedonobacteraceae bacterium]
MATVSSAPLASLSQTGLLLADHILHERYRILQEIGQGGFGAVYKATDTRIADRMVAIKEMRQGSTSTQEISDTTESFKQEAFMLARLKHPNLPSIYDYFTEAGRCYVVMDFIEGETLEDYLARGGNGRPPGIPLSVSEVLQIGIQLCNVLDYLHTRQPPIIFRDLKPSNIMRAVDGQLYLIDFGIARIFKQGKTNDTTALGSPGYAAPEQYGKAQSTPRSDIYALGVTMHELLTGSDPSLSPFIFASPVLPGYAELSSLILRMVEKNPEDRPSNVAYIKLELERMATGRPPGLMELPPNPVNKQNIPPLMPPPTSPGSYQIPTSYQSEDSSQRMRMAYQPDPQTYHPPYQQSYLPPYQQPTRAKGGISRRSVVIGLVSLVVGGSLISQVFSRHHDSHSFQYDQNGDQNANYGPGGNNTFLPAGLSPSVLLGLAWSPDGKSIATGAGSGTIQILDASNRSVRLTYTGHSNGVSAVAWSPDSKRIASASYDQTVQVWDAQTGQSLLTYSDYNSPVLTVAWSPDGKYLLSGSEDHQLKVWDATTGTTIGTDYGHEDQVTSVAWSPDGLHVASGSADQTVMVLQANPLTPVYTYQGHSDVVQAIAWSPNGKRIASASNDQTVQLWDVTNGGNAYIYRGHSDQVWAVAWSPDGKHIASGSFDDTMQVWRASDGKLVHSSQDGSQVVSVAWSPDGHTVVWGDGDGEIGKEQV